MGNLAASMEEKEREERRRCPDRFRKEKRCYCRQTLALDDRPIPPLPLILTALAPRPSPSAAAPTADGPHFVSSTGAHCPHPRSPSPLAQRRCSHG
ncbi:hypothetical protein ACLOJK_039982 [Asimina triloba]